MSIRKNPIIITVTREVKIVEETYTDIEFYLDQFPSGQVNLKAKRLDTGEEIVVAIVYEDLSVLLESSDVEYDLLNIDNNCD